MTQLFTSGSAALLTRCVFKALIRAIFVTMVKVEKVIIIYINCYHIRALKIITFGLESFKTSLIKPG